MAALLEKKARIKNLKRKLEEEELLSITLWRAFRGVQNDIERVEWKDHLHKDLTKGRLASVMGETKMKAKIRDKILKSVEPECCRLAVKVSSSIDICWAIEVSKPFHNCSQSVLE